MAAATDSERPGDGGALAIPPRTRTQEEEEERTSSGTNPLSADSQSDPPGGGGVSPAISSRAYEAQGSVHTDLGDISRAATKHELNLARQSLKANYAAVRQSLQEEEEERSRPVEQRGGRIRI